MRGQMRRCSNDERAPLQCTAAAAHVVSVVRKRYQPRCPRVDSVVGSRRGRQAVAGDEDGLWAPRWVVVMTAAVMCGGCCSLSRFRPLTSSDLFSSSSPGLQLPALCFGTARFRVLSVVMASGAHTRLWSPRWLLGRGVVAHPVLFSSLVVQFPHVGPMRATGHSPCLHCWRTCFG